MSLVLSGLAASGDTPDVSEAQVEAGAQPPTLDPFANLKITGAGSDLLQATVEFSGNGDAGTEPAGLTGIAGSTSGSIWETSPTGISPAQLSAILHGVTVQLGAIGNGRSQTGTGNIENASVTITDLANNAQAQGGVSYTEVQAPSTISGVAPISVDYGATIHPFANVPSRTRTAAIFPCHLLSGTDPLMRAL
jgi:hypothetical protein